MPEVFKFSHGDTTGRTLTLTVQRLDTPDVASFFNPVTKQFATGLTYSARKIALVEAINAPYSLGAEYKGLYLADIEGLSGIDGTIDPGLVRLIVHKEDGLNIELSRVAEGYIRNGQFVRADQLISTRATPEDVRTMIRDILSGGLAIPMATRPPTATPSILEALSWIVARSTFPTENTQSVVRQRDANGNVIGEASLQPGSPAIVGQWRSA